MNTCKKTRKKQEKNKKKTRKKQEKMRKKLNEHLFTDYLQF